MLAAVFLLGLLLGSADIPGHKRDADAALRRGIHKIRHVVVIMQENRSFDSYFGTYPGRRRDPDAERRSDVCVPTRRRTCCQRRTTTRHDRNAGGPHDTIYAIRDIDHGKMDGFVSAGAESGGPRRHAVDNPALLA